MYSNPAQTDADRSLVASTALWGAVAGQLVFGSLADYIGRKAIFVTTLLLITFGALLSAFAVDSSTFTIYEQLALYRFILGECACSEHGSYTTISPRAPPCMVVLTAAGFGVGGEYPLSATYSSESATAANKGKMVRITRFLYVYLLRFPFLFFLSDIIAYMWYNSCRTL